MTRGDLVIVSLPGFAGKPRPAVVLQSDAHSDGPTVMVCPLTSDLVPAPAYRLDLEPTSGNGLRKPSQAMLDKVRPSLRDKCGPPIGRLDDAEMTELTRRVVALIGAG